MSNKITVTATINADAKKVWDFYNQPEHITKWNYANDDWQCPKASNDMQVTSHEWEAKDGSFGFDFEAVYAEIVEGEKFIYTLTDGRKVEVLFKQADKYTEVITFDAESQNSLELSKARLANHFAQLQKIR